MENSLLAPRDAVVAKVLAAKGDSLAVDQPILEFSSAVTAADGRSF